MIGDLIENSLAIRDIKLIAILTELFGLERI